MTGYSISYLLDHPEIIESAILTVASHAAPKQYWNTIGSPQVARAAASLLGLGEGFTRPDSIWICTGTAGRYHDSPIVILRDAIRERNAQNQYAVTAAFVNEFRTALTQAEIAYRRAETRSRHQAMADYTRLPPHRLTQVAATMPRLKRAPELTLTQKQLRDVLETASIRPTKSAIKALREARQALYEARVAKHRIRPAVKPPTDKRRCLPAGTPSMRLSQLRCAAVETAARAIMPFGSALGDEVTVHLIDGGSPEKPDYVLSTFEERRNYKRGPIYYSFVKGTSHRISVPVNWRLSVERRGLAIVAGALTLAASPRLAPIGIDAVDAIVAIPSRGFSASVQRRVYARVSPVGKSLRDAGGPWLHIQAADLTPTADAINRCRNAERRRLMLTIYGLSRWLTDINARPVHEDHYGRLYRVERAGLEPIVAVAVRDATDPSREYVLRVPPQSNTAHEAVAATFGLTAEQYHPTIET